VGDRASILRAALERRQALVVPGCHDALSARIIEATQSAASDWLAA
jgi:2-methylisocitrate lyase-like PEP mutase family enzyme